MKEQKIFLLGLVFNSTVRQEKLNPVLGMVHQKPWDPQNAGRHWLRFLCVFLLWSSRV